EPCTLRYGDFSVFKPGPWSQGPVFLQQLGILEGCDLRGMGLGSVEYVHVLVESAKLAFADREAWYGDPHHTAVPMAQLLAPAYSALRRSLIAEDAAADPQPGRPCARESWMPRPAPEQ